MQPSKKAFALIPLVALFGLAACDAVTAKPKNYEDPLLTIVGDEATSNAVYHNTTKYINDSYHDGSLASDVLDRILYEQAVSIFGRYNKIVKGIDGIDPANEITLKQAVSTVINNGGTGSDIASQFINGHKAYWTTDSNGKRIDDNGNPVANPTSSPASESEINRLIAKWDAIEDLISTKLFDAFKSGSYSDRGIYSEKEYVNSLKNNGKGVGDNDAEYYNGIIEKSIKPEEAFNEGIINRAHYQNKFLPNEDEGTTSEINYVEKDIIPDIYKSLLVNQYLVDKKYNAIGSSFARKVNILAINNRTDFPKQNDYLMNKFVKEINAKPENANKHRVDGYGDYEVYDRNPVDVQRFYDYSDAWEGFMFDYQDGKGLRNKILDEINETNPSMFKIDKTDDANRFYPGTTYGEMIKNYKTLSDICDPDKWKNVDQSVVNDFTSSGKYKKEIGKAIKENEIKTKSNTTTGWYIQNGGLSELPESIRSRLFSFTVSTAFKENPADQEALDRWQYVEGQWTYAKPAGESSYLARINNAYYLKVDSSPQGSDPMNDILFYDAGSSTYYVIQIEEAVRPTKIGNTTDSDVYPSAKKEEIINEVSSVVAKTSSYDSLAKKYWLEQMAIKYNDQTVYDYFKTNYPELFENK